MVDSSTLSQIGGITAAFGVAVLFFRIQRHLSKKGHGKKPWIAVSDWLMIGATVTSLLIVIVPLVSFDIRANLLIKLVHAACATSSVLAVGYIFSILAHYRLILNIGKEKPHYSKRRDTPLAEKILVILTFAVAFVIFILVFILLIVPAS